MVNTLAFASLMGGWKPHLGGKRTQRVPPFRLSTHDSHAKQCVLKKEECNDALLLEKATRPQRIRVIIRHERGRRSGLQALMKEVEKRS